MFVKSRRLNKICCVHWDTLLIIINVRTLVPKWLTAFGLTPVTRYVTNVTCYISVTDNCISLFVAVLARLTVVYRYLWKYVSQLQTFKVS